MLCIWFIFGKACFQYWLYFCLLFGCMVPHHTGSALKCSAFNVTTYEIQLSGLQGMLIMQLCITYVSIRMIFTIPTTPGDNKNRQHSNKHLYVKCKRRSLDFCHFRIYVLQDTLVNIMVFRLDASATCCTISNFYCMLKDKNRDCNGQTYDKGAGIKLIHCDSVPKMWRSCFLCHLWICWTCFQFDIYLKKLEVPSTELFWLQNLWASTY